MQDSTAYIGLDVHSRTCTMAWLNEAGDYHGPSTFQTSGQTIRKNVDEIKAKEKIVTLEEGPLAFWTARTLEEVVERTVVCDPRENYLISRSARKDDEADAKALARLLRLGEVKEVYQPSGDRRALFKQAASHYADLRDQLRKLKQKIKARLKRWGLWDIPSADVYSKSGRSEYLEKLSHDRIRTQVRSLYRLLDQTSEEKQKARRELIELGQPYSEIQEFQEIPGIGPIGAHLFDAIIQTPHRFSTKQELYRYCKLGIESRSSGDRREQEQLDDAGHGELKHISYQAFRPYCAGGEGRQRDQNLLRSIAQANKKPNSCTPEHPTQDRREHVGALEE
ncbi:transposase [Salinibacter ruber]|uniref:Transposase n=1 Tax=Salinibacter ruber TaxID=146919 RepID=A0A9X2R5G2_9BACT|nr:transposase [Salinibacter ruber]MCS3857796.1 transposase [Salinibacter ruber]MCS3864622.1 transposase [Salinibacter ruber]